MAATRNTSMDSGYSWVILFASSISYAIIAGISKSYGILYTEFLRYFGQGSGNTAWIGSVFSFVVFGLGPISNHLCEVLSFRSVTICGGVLFGLGIFISSFVPKMEILYLTYGVLGGIGGGLVLTPLSVVVSFYFEKRRALANGIMIAVSGVGVFFFPYLYRHLIDRYSLRGALMILGGVTANICVGGSMLVQPFQLLPKHYRVANNDHSKRSKATKSSLLSKLNLKGIFDFSLFRNRKYRTYVFAYTLNTFAYISIFAILPAQVLEAGYSKDQVAVLLSITGATEIVSKLFFGWLVDLRYFNVKNILLSTFIVSGIAAVAISFFSTFNAYIIYTVCLGVFPGSYFSLMPVVLLDSITMPQLPKGIGLTALCMGFGAVLTSPIAGWIEDMTGDWNHSFWYVGAMHFLAAFFIIIQPFVEKGNKEIEQKPQESKLIDGECENVTIPTDIND